MEETIFYQTVYVCMFVYILFLFFFKKGTTHKMSSTINKTILHKYNDLTISKNKKIFYSFLNLEKVHVFGGMDFIYGMRNTCNINKKTYF